MSESVKSSRRACTHTDRHTHVQTNVYSCPGTHAHRHPHTCILACAVEHIQTSKTGRTPETSIPPGPSQERVLAVLKTENSCLALVGRKPRAGSILCHCPLFRGLFQPRLPSQLIMGPGEAGTQPPRSQASHTKPLSQCWPHRGCHVLAPCTARVS